MVFNKPEINFPLNNSELTSIFEFEIKLISQPAEYKIIIQRNEFFDVIKEINFSSEEIDKNYYVPITNVVFEQYRNYYWRVITYSSASNDPNSFTELYNFRIVP